MHRILPLLILLLAHGASSAEAPLIPREVLYDNPAREMLSISPDGTRLGFLAPSEKGVLNVWVQDVESGMERMVTDDDHRGIYDYDWAYDSRHVLFVRDRDGDENWHLFVTNIESGESRDLTPFEGVAAQNLMTSRSQPHHVAIALNKENPTRHDMYRVDLRTGELTLEARNPGDVQRWLADHKLHVRAASALDAETSDTILRVRDSLDAPWRDIVRWSFQETGSVLYKKLLAFTPDGKHLFVQSPKGSDMTHLALIDAGTGEEVQVLAQDERSDIGNYWWEPVVLFSPGEDRIQAVMFDYLLPEWRILDDSIRADFEALEALDPGFFFVDHRDDEDENWIVRFVSDRHPGRTYIYETATKKAKLVFDSNPELEDYELAQKRPVTVTARDGRPIPCYLTLPVGSSGKNLPLVMHPHGGPWARDYWFYTPDVQMMTNRGYAVIQPNFRGSVGYGRDHINAGNGEWGVGSMQHDVSDVVQWAIDEGIADPERVAIFGGSYGGYATLAGVAFTPELYRCAISVVGPSNLATLFESFPPTWAVRKLRWKKRVGPVEEDPAFGRRISPLYHADQIRAPLLIGHGANDSRVKLVESESIARALQERGMPVEFVVYPDEGHGFDRPENNLDWVARVDRFLARHLGGRSQPFESIEGTSADVRLENP